MSNKPYLIDAIVGNGRMLGSLGRTGRLYRLWWPHIDHPQHVDAIRTGIRLSGADSAATWFDDAADGWEHRIAYEPGTNIVRTEASRNGFPLSVLQRDFSLPEGDVHVRHYTFTNETAGEVSFRFVWYSSFHVNESPLYNTTTFREDADAIVHFHKRSFFAVSGANVCAEFQCGSAWEAAVRGELNGNAIDMRPDGAMAWDLKLKGGESATLPVYIAAGTTMPEALLRLAETKERPVSQWLEATRIYWHSELRGARPCPGGDRALAELYERSVLMFKLMSDSQTGSLLAAPEADESFSRCGGYSFCWGRDAAFITTALDRTGLTEASRRFYEWTLSAQEADGSWQQRHYHDGSLAPSWGLQIDEGGSIVWGMWQHYAATGDESFARRMWPTVAKGAAFLAGFVDPDTGLPKPSVDLWEERDAEHTYSAAAVSAGLRAASSFARLMGDDDSAAAWERMADRIAEAIENDCWNEAEGSFYRGLHLKVGREEYERAVARGAEGGVEHTAKGYPVYRLKYDPTVDISLLGVSTPFGVLPPEHDYMRRQADAIERKLTSPVVGGIKRYENDPYIGGNPWILTTLWLAHYRTEIGQYEEARKLLRWAIDHRTETGLLPEQVDKASGAPAWIVPLTWSHAMFVLAVDKLAAAGELAEVGETSRAGYPADA
ncbi:glycoside hydrolase family 15 protein [Cohnella algarum]|uniref:glycoside hydrolase family 15 protein n=1 Tax=Cohnella algarum TaxID=2044859 RepID=UPI001967CF36|nr:glycoside hydrolase family 15 protein [Cohnella algarum]MBN2982144.1 glycoside hydrolase family 15 [Cohnella algarum]